LNQQMSPKLVHAMRSIRPLNEFNELLTLGDKKKYPNAKKRLLTFLIGKSYDLDLGVQRSLFDYVQATTASSVKSDLRKAQTKGDLKEVRRLQNLLKEIKRGEGLTL